MEAPYKTLRIAGNPFNPSDTIMDSRVPHYASFLAKSRATLAVVRAGIQLPRPCSPSLALPFGDATQLLRGGQLALESGLARCADGSVYVATSSVLRGCTGVMLQWWFTFCDRGSLYRLWHPEDHVWCTWNPEYLHTASNLRVAGHERGNSHVVVEHMGKFANNPAEDLHIDFVDPAEWGFTPAACQEAGVRAVFCMRVHVLREPGLGHLRTGYVVHIARDAADGDGIELRSRFWLAKDVCVVGQAVFLPHCVANWLVSRRFAKVATLPMTRAASVWRHATEEFRVLGNILAELFEMCSTPTWKTLSATELRSR